MIYYDYKTDGKRIPDWETLRHELVLRPHIIYGNEKLSRLSRKEAVVILQLKNLITEIFPSYT